MVKKIATLTIGQAPRVDMLPLLEKYLPAGDMEHFGVLDGLTYDEVKAQFGPGDGDKILVSRMKDGAEARLGSSKIEAGLQRKIDKLGAEGYKVIMLLCTGEFHKLKSDRALLIEPDRVIPVTVNAMIADRQLGIMVPAEEQIVEQEAKWHMLRRKPVCDFASPYTGSDDELISAAKRLQEAGAEFIVLDCMGYNEKHTVVIEKAVTVPVLLSNRLMARIVAEFI